MKVNVTGGERQGFAQEEFEAAGVSVNGEDGRHADLDLTDGENVLIRSFAPDEWTAFAVQKEE